MDAKLVKELRAKSGAGMMDCKKALVETNGNIEDAMIFLREIGLHPGRSCGRLWSSCGWDRCHSFIVYIDALLLSADWGSWWVRRLATA